LLAYLSKIHCNIIIPSMTRPINRPVFFGVSTYTLYAFLFSIIRVTFPTHLILPNLVTLIIFGESRRCAVFFQPFLLSLFYV